jgi:hypothetical protein
VNSWITGRRIVSLPFSDHCAPLIDNEQSLARLTVRLVKVAHESDCKYVELRPISLTQALPLFQKSKSFYLQRLDLRPGADEVFRRLHRDSIQRKIRRAEREKLRIEEGRSTELVRTFYQLVLHTRRRQGLPPQPLAWFHDLAECMGKSLVIRIAYKDRQAIAGILTLEHKNILVYKYGASDERFHNLGGMACLFWEAIHDAIGREIVELDMGRSDISNPGLITFKERWGATRTTLTYWKTLAPLQRPSSARDWGSSFGHWVCTHLPDVCLRTIGSVFYKHVG